MRACTVYATSIMIYNNYGRILSLTAIIQTNLDVFNICYGRINDHLDVTGNYAKRSKVTQLHKLSLEFY